MQTFNNPNGFPCSGIPEVSVCLPECDATEPQMCPVRIEENREDNSSPFKSHSCTQLHQKTSQGYHSPQHKRCSCCGHRQSLQSNVCKGQTNAFHQADCSASPVKTVHSCSPSRLPSCHNKMQCHWLHGPHDGSNHKPVQHHMVTVRCRLFPILNIYLHLAF